MGQFGQPPNPPGFPSHAPFPPPGPPGQPGAGPAGYGQQRPGQPAPPAPQVVHVVARPGAFSWAIGWIIATVAMGFIFLVGLGAGVAFMFAGSTFDSMVMERPYREGSGRSIAIIPVVGMIDEYQAQFVHSAVDYVLQKSPASAVVLRVDSGGGGVAASDQIWYEIQRLHDANIPVVASFGGVAASGGYYIACGADAIVAEETCITGSIGVIAQILTFEGLMGKIGVEPVTLVATGSPEKNVANDVFRSWNDQDKQKVRVMLDAAYDVFRRRVTSGRKSVITNPATIGQLADGSIYTAKQAKDNGLIDAIGYLDDAIGQAEILARIPTGQASVFLVHEPPSLFGSRLMLSGPRESPAASLLDADRIRGLVNDLASPRIMYLMR